MGGPGFLASIGTQKDIPITLMIMKTTINIGKNQKFRGKKKTKRKCRSYLNQTFFSKNLIYDLLNVFTEPQGAINIKKM